MTTSIHLLKNLPNVKVISCTASVIKPQLTHQSVVDSLPLRALAATSQHENCDASFISENRLKFYFQIIIA